MSLLPIHKPESQLVRVLHRIGWGAKPPSLKGLNDGGPVVLGVQLSDENLNDDLYSVLSDKALLS